MSLFFTDRINEQKEEENPLKNTVTFTHSWIVTAPPPDQPSRIPNVGKRFRTSYKFANGMWNIGLHNGQFQISYSSIFGPPPSLNGSISYNLFCDNGMRFLYYTSPKVKMIKDTDDREMYKIPDGFLTKMVEAFDQRKVARMIIFVELRFPTKYFCRPFEAPGCDLTRIVYGQNIDEYPATDMENDYRFALFKKSDYTIKCPDGSISCHRAALNMTSEFFNEHFKKSSDNELTVAHSIDALKPIIIYLHTYCFKMPKVYDLDYAKRLLAAVDFFKIEKKTLLKAVHKALCHKFVSEDQDFDSILQWTSLASRRLFYYLGNMIATVVADKYYFKWQQTFPQDARNFENALFLDIFGTENPGMFVLIDEIFENSLFTNVILD